MKWRGPYEITNVIGPVSYKLKMPDQWRGHRVFHHKKLKPYILLVFPAQAKQIVPPEPDFVDGEPEYEVTEVLSKKKIRKVTYFLIHWEGYRLEEDSWEPEENLVKAKESIATYRSRGQGLGGGGHNVRNWLTTTRWQVTPV